MKSFWGLLHLANHCLVVADPRASTQYQGTQTLCSVMMQLCVHVLAEGFLRYPLFTGHEALLSGIEEPQ